MQGYLLEKRNIKLLGLGLLFGLILRLAYINIPIMEVLSDYQEKYAMIARNFYYSGFNILYPKLDYIGEVFNELFFKLHLFSFYILVQLSGTLPSKP